MRERLVTLVCALGALALFYVMFVGTGGHEATSREPPRAASFERRASGYFAASEWLERSGVRVLSLRERFTALGAGTLDIAPRGNLLIVTLPAAQGFRTEELLPLDRWIRAGNALLVAAALADRPDWAFAAGPVSPDDIAAITGLTLEPVEARTRRLQGEADPVEAARRAARRFSAPRRIPLRPTRTHAYFRDVASIVALSDYPSPAWEARVPYDTFFLALAERGDTGDDVFWTRRLGDGRIVLSGFGSLFTNRAIGLEDNARLFANIVAANVAPGGAVIFDDLRQGATAGYDPAKFFADPRLWWTVALLLGVWLAWVLGGTRLRAPAAPAPAPRETELVRTAGGLLARLLPPHVAAQRLFVHFFDGIRERLGLPRNGAPTWEWLERHPRITRAELEALRAGFAAAQGGGRLRLGALHDLLVRLERRLA